MKIKQPIILVTGADTNMGLITIKQLCSYQGIGKLYIGSVDPIYPASMFAESSDYLVPLPDFYKKKKCVAQDYLNFLYQFVQEKKVDILMASSIFELELMAEHREMFAQVGCRVIVESLFNVQAFQDKIASIELFNKIQIPALISQEVELVDGVSQLPDVPFPFFLKPRHAGARYGSVGLAIINNEEEFRNWDAVRDDAYQPYMAQEFVGKEYKEYSGTCTFTKDGEVKDVMVMEREKIEIVTVRGKYSTETEALIPMVRELAKKIGGMYVLNMQFKLVGNTPYIFEINPRFGAGEAIRIMLGADMFFSVLSEYCDIQNKAGHPLRYGTVFRIYEEVFVPEATAQKTTQLQEEIGGVKQTQV